MNLIENIRSTFTEKKIEKAQDRIENIGHLQNVEFPVEADLMDYKLLSLIDYTLKQEGINKTPSNDPGYFETPFDFYERELPQDIAITAMAFYVLKQKYQIDVPIPELYRFIKSQLDSDKPTNLVNIIPGMQIVLRNWPSDIYKGTNYTLGVNLTYEQTKLNTLMAIATDKTDAALKSIMKYPAGLLAKVDPVFRCLIANNILKENRMIFAEIPSYMEAEVVLNDETKQPIIIVYVGSLDDSYSYPSNIQGVTVQIQKKETAEEYRKRVTQAEEAPEAQPAPQPEAQPTFEIEIVA